MSNVAFLWIFSRGMELGVIVLCLLPLRAFFRKKVPRLFSYMLWAALPVNFVYRLAVRFIELINRHVVDYVYQSPKILVDEKIVQVMRLCWCIGTLVVVIGMVRSYIILMRRLVGSIRLQKDVYVTDRIRLPFTLGMIHPKIYLPYSLKEEYYESVIMHERVHINRRDIWMKYLAIGIRNLFWFQPVLWFAYRMFVNDMEEACDETVLRQKGPDFREEYAHSLLELSDQDETIRDVAIGYGAGVIKSRIKNVMYYEVTEKHKCIVATIVCCLFVIISGLISWQVPRIVQGELPKEIYVEGDMSVTNRELRKTELVEEDEIK